MSRLYKYADLDAAVDLSKPYLLQAYLEFSSLPYEEKM